ncbi:hypothetical protein VZT92_000324 [Zoarces viviparus]|uniref:GFO/IDH/MocA-like oxidoreductase domain-containing protein n=1 Tax=Zoarces viviparus TaxID=48416 RepID=A0AAW1G7Z9_ZOAVI
MATRWGLCGVGKISRDFSVPMKTLPPGTLPNQAHYVFTVRQTAVIASRSLERAKEFAKRHGIPKAYGSYVELANDLDIGHCVLGSAAHTEHCGAVGFLLRPSQAIWSRCFPVHAELHIPRSVEKELGGGALLDIGVYCLQFVLMVFNGERPDSIQATGVLLDSGVDESVIVVMEFSRNRMAFCAFSIAARLPNDAVISGTEGSIKVIGPMHCPTTLIVNDKETNLIFPLNSSSSAGLKESPRMPLADSVLLTEIMDEIRKRVGVTFSQDSQ